MVDLFNKLTTLMILDPLVPIGKGFFEPGFKRLRRQMRADLITEPVVMPTQAHPALNPVPCGKIVAPDQVMGLQIAPPAADSTASGLTDHLTPASVSPFEPVGAERIVFRILHYLTCKLKCVARCAPSMGSLFFKASLIACLSGTRSVTTLQK